MTSPTTSIPTTYVAASGDRNVDALLGLVKWGGAVGTGATLSYSFPWASGGTAAFSGASGAPYSSLSEYTSGGALNDAQQTAAISALGAWAAVANVTFPAKPLVETSTDVGDIRFALTSVTETSATGGVAWGWATLPDGYAPAAGDIWITTYGGSADSDWGPSSGNYQSLLHEVGHALGLKHPFEAPVTLPPNMDSEQYSVMSYTEGPHSLYFKVTTTPSGTTGSLYNIHPDTPMLLDIAAMQYLYGANMAYRTGNDVYTFDPSTPFMRTIWDAGGNDTISVSNFTLGTIIDLQPGHFSKITIPSDSTEGFSFAPGTPPPNYDGTDNLAIAYGVTIENAVGGAGDDTIHGNAVANDLNGGAGNDTIDGGAGIDTASFTGIAKNFALTRTGTGFTVTANKGTEGTDTLTSVERLHFTDPATHTDSYLALDLDGDAGEVAKILGVVFGPASVQGRPDYVGIGLGYADGGMSYADLMQLALNAAKLTANTAVVDTLYFNVMGTAPDANTEASYVALLQNGSYTPATLGVMAADTSQNQTSIGLTGLVDHGLAFIPG